MRLRVSLRFLMVLVAVSAICVGPIYKYVQTLRQKSRDYALRAKMDADMANVMKAKLRLRRLTPEDRQATQKLADWHARHNEAYTRAASRPWTTVTEEPRPEEPPVRPTFFVTPYVPPPIRKPPKPMDRMTEAEKLEHWKQIAQDVHEETQRLMNRGRSGR